VQAGRTAGNFDMENRDSNPQGSVPQAGATLTLDEVAAADFSGVTPLAVLGWPIRHSVSPQMHNAALAELAKADARFASWRYYRVEVPPEKLKEALDLLAAKGFLGLNLTIPHKVIALEHVRVADMLGLSAGAVNTLLRKDGQWMGYNTDGTGIKAALASQPFGIRHLDEVDVVLLGAGGAARAIAAICLASACKSLWIGNRSLERLDELLEQMKSFAGRGILHGFDIAMAEEAGLPRKALVINATSLGLKPEDASPINLSLFDAGTMVFDTTYGRHKCALLQQAESLGMAASDGLPMLVQQGLGALDEWTGHPRGGSARYEIMYKAAKEALGIHV
jgi:shikimate dehydrogenase